MTRHGKPASNLSLMLKLWRAVHGLTLRTLAKDIGTSHATLMRIEQGYDVDTATFFRLLAWLRADSGRAKGKPADVVKMAERRGR